MIRPSSLPMLAQCPKFAGGAGEFAELGTDRHAALHAHFNGDDSLLELLDEESQVAIRWAADYIRLKAPMSDFPIEWEKKITGCYPNFEEFTGTPDAVCGPELFDFKWRRRDYTAQMCAYALPMLEHRGKVRVHLLFGAERREEVFWLDNEAVDRVLLPILDSLPRGEPRVCDYCGWCANRLTCPAMTGPAKTVALGYSDLAEIPNWHPSEMEKAEHVALALTVWRRVLKKWGESVEFHAMECATKKGLKLPGYELKEKQGRKAVGDTQRAYELSGLQPAQFLKACGVRLNTSKKTGLVGLDTLYKETEGTLVAAKRKLEKQLAEVITRGKPTLQLVVDKDNEGEEEL